jgi:hypothetical protein
MTHTKVILVTEGSPLLAKYRGRCGIAYYIDKKYYAVCMQCRCKIQDFHEVDKR